MHEDDEETLRRHGVSHEDESKLWQFVQLITERGTEKKRRA